MSLFVPLLSASTFTPIFSSSPASEKCIEMTPMEPVIVVGWATIASQPLAR